MPNNRMSEAQLREKLEALIPLEGQMRKVRKVLGLSSSAGYEEVSEKLVSLYSFANFSANLADAYAQEVARVQEEVVEILSLAYEEQSSRLAADKARLEAEQKEQAALAELKKAERLSAVSEKKLKEAQQLLAERENAIKKAGDAIAALSQSTTELKQQIEELNEANRKLEGFAMQAVQEADDAADRAEYAEGIAAEEAMGRLRAEEIAVSEREARLATEKKALLSTRKLTAEREAKRSSQKAKEAIVAEFETKIARLTDAVREAIEIRDNSDRFNTLIIHGLKGELAGIEKELERTQNALDDAIDERDSTASEFVAIREKLNRVSEALADAEEIAMEEHEAALAAEEARREAVENATASDLARREAEEKALRIEEAFGMGSIRGFLMETTLREYGIDPEKLSTDGEMTKKQKIAAIGRKLVGLVGKKEDRLQNQIGAELMKKIRAAQKLDKQNSADRDSQTNIEARIIAQYIDYKKSTLDKITDEEHKKEIAGIFADFEKEHGLAATRSAGDVVAELTNEEASKASAKTVASKVIDSELSTHKSKRAVKLISGTTLLGLLLAGSVIFTVIGIGRNIDSKLAAISDEGSKDYVACAQMYKSIEQSTSYYSKLNGTENKEEKLNTALTESLRLSEEATKKEIELKEAIANRDVKKAEEIAQQIEEIKTQMEAQKAIILEIVGTNADIIAQCENAVVDSNSKADAYMSSINVMSEKVNQFSAENIGDLPEYKTFIDEITKAAGLKENFDSYYKDYQDAKAKNDLVAAVEAMRNMQATADQLNVCEKNVNAAYEKLFEKSPVLDVKLTDAQFKALKTRFAQLSGTAKSLVFGKYDPSTNKVHLLLECENEWLEPYYSYVSFEASTKYTYKDSPNWYNEIKRAKITAIHVSGRLEESIDGKDVSIIVNNNGVAVSGTAEVLYGIDATTSGSKGKALVIVRNGDEIVYCTDVETDKVNGGEAEETIKESLRKEAESLVAAYETDFDDESGAEI